MALSFKTYKQKEKRHEIMAVKIKSSDLSEAQAMDPAAKIGDYFIQQNDGFKPVLCPADKFQFIFEEKI